MPCAQSRIHSAASSRHSNNAPIDGVNAPDAVLQGGTRVTQEDTFFDRTLTVITFQWGFAFVTEDNKISRNAAIVKPGEKVLFKILSNDVIHGFNIPVASITAEIDPDEMRQVWIRAPDKPGKYLIQCVNYCGVGHAQMKAWLVVEGAEDEEKTSGLTDGETTDGA